MDVSVSEACVRGGLCESVRLCAFMKDGQKKERESEMWIHTGTTTRLSLQDLTDLFVVEILVALILYPILPFPGPVYTDLPHVHSAFYRSLSDNYKHFQSRLEEGGFPF